MPVLLKSPAEIDQMRAAGAVVARVHETLRELVRPGVTTGELDAIAHQLIVAEGGSPSFLGYRGFPGSICTSVNDEVLHGVPGGRVLRDGDIISIDVGVKLGGFHADAARTWPVGTVSDAARELIELTEACFWIGFEELREGGRIGDAAAAVQHYAESRGFGVVREYAGHWVGRQMHEDPSVPNYGRPGSGSLLRRGMTIALEPMITAGNPETRVLPDCWTVVAIDGSLAAHYEHTVAIAGDRAKVLTALETAVV